MTYATILCPVDFSATTVPQVRYAAALARATGATMELLHVVPDTAPGPDWRHTREVAAEQKLRLLLTDPELTTLAVRPMVRYGNVERTIVDTATEHRADVIVIGAHGTTGLTRFLMGNTAEYVLRASPCPTLLVTNRVIADAPPAAQAA